MIDYEIEVVGSPGPTGPVGPAGTIADGDKGDIIVSGGGEAWAIDPAVLTTFGRTLTAAASAAAGRTAIGLVIGTDVQAYDSDLAAIAALTTTAFGRGLLALADAAAMRSAAGLGSSSILNVDTDGALTANSDTVVASQKAVKTFVASAVTGVLKYQTGQDCSANPNYPAASKGFAYVVTVAGKIGGASGVSVDVGDTFFALADNAGGTQATVGSSWAVLEHNLAGALLTANNLSDLTSPSTARANLGLAIGADVQAYDADLAAIAALTTTTFGRALLALADAAALRSAAGLAAIAASGSASDLASGTMDPARTSDNALGGLDAHLATSGFYIDTAPLAQNTTGAGVADRLQLYPWTPSRDTTISQIGAECTALLAGSNVKVLAYDSDPTTGGPGNLLKETGSLSTASTGYKSEAWSYTFKKGVRYWLGTRHSSTATLRVYSATVMLAIGRPAATGGMANVVMTTLAFATAAPNPFGALTAALLQSVGGYSVILLLA